MIKHLDHLNITVANLDASLRWYGDLFDFEKVESGTWRGSPWAIIKAGEALLCLYEHADYELKSPDELKAHGLNHFGLRITDGHAFKTRAEKLGVDIKFDGGFEWPNSTAYYVEDPTGHEIEVAAWRDDTVRF